ncbi:MAG: hypothetical protein Q8922_14265 [Bacteroidota bacterium]|nr:hypothetical protein [Bacteroidota bacterium]MDP4233261.1 hypothetical protein [Bacteroidota bacterium]MDP4242119.1 hypothetical protein [Bacteroidota bacterium]MDP4289082.1 hypothetical protein [Bacteroidota bacterium]
MTATLLETRITSLYEAEQHVYAIPPSGKMPSQHWTMLTSERRVSLRSRAIEIWKHYLENDGHVVPHPAVQIPELRTMLSHPDGESIIEEL